MFRLPVSLLAVASLFAVASKGPVIGFNTSFEKPGLYRVFLQFNHGGKIRTGDFTINVKGPAAS